MRQKHTERGGNRARGNYASLHARLACKQEVHVAKNGSIFKFWKSANFKTHLGSHIERVTSQMTSTVGLISPGLLPHCSDTIGL